MKKFINYIIVGTFFATLATIIVLLCLELRILGRIAEREVPSIVVSDDGNIDHGEQRADNNVTIMFNYE